MTQSSIPLAPQLLREVVDDLAAGLVASPEMGTAKDKVRMLLAAIAGKCALCSANTNGHTSLNAVADCPEADCPLNDFGPSVYECVRAKLESQGYIAGGVQ